MAATRDRGRSAGSDAQLDLRSLAVDVFGAIGALVEEKADGFVDVLVPDAYRSAVDGAGYLRLTCNPERATEQDARLLAVGSPIAEQIIEVGGDLGLASRWQVAGLRWSRRQALNLDRWPVKFTNARFVGDGIESTFTSHYLLMNFQVSYLSDEKHDELRTVVVDVKTLQASPLYQQVWREALPPRGESIYLPEWLRPPGVVWPEPIALIARDRPGEGSFDGLPDSGRLRRVHRRGLTVLQRSIVDTVTGHRRRASHQVELEQLRIDAFYDDSEAELRRRLQRADTDERRRTIESKIAANRSDRAHKLADIREKHRLRVAARLINAAFISQPKVRTRVRVENRYAGAELAVVFDPLTGELELPTCASCDEATPSVHLCANGHLVCDACALGCAFCKREYCRDCGVGTCVVCGRPVCSQSQTHCRVCNRITCPDHRGACHSGEAATTDGRSEAETSATAVSAPDPRRLP
ncbi:MAG: hypothetical protein ACRDIY_10675 [Chloroflexota bacterium]